MFKKDFKKRKYVFGKVGNPFFEDTKILYTLVTKNVTNTSANNLFMGLELLQQNSILYTKREFLFSEAKLFMKLLNVTSCHCIKTQTLLSYIQNPEKVASLKQDCQLYSYLYVTCQNREGNLEEFFAHENHCSLLITVNLWENSFN